MFTKSKTISLKLFLVLFLIVTQSESFSQGHYVGSSFNTNDYFIPASPGWVFSLYYSYSQQDYHNNLGSKTDLIEISQDPPFSIDMGQSVKTNSVIPMIIHFGKGKVLNARWGVLVLPLLNSPSANIALDFYTGQETPTTQNIEINSFGLGDFYIQPIWLTWEKNKIATTFSYGIWMPTGKYKANDPENVGLGYWSNNLRIASRYKPNAKISLTAATTYEINSKQKGVDFTEANHFTFDYAASYNFTMGHEIGFFGHGSWQTGDDKGLKANPLDDRILGVGAYGSYWFIPGKIGVLARTSQNFETKNRFGGFSFQIGLNYLLF